MENVRFDVSVIIPALNEEKNIQDAIYNTLQGLEDHEINGEIIVVNDGSTDKTGELVKEIMKKDKRVRMLTHEVCRGIGASYWAGVDQSRGDVITLMPGDNENDPEETLRYFNLLEHVDIIIPFIFNREVRPLFRNILSFVYRFIVNATFVVNFNYTNGTILFRKQILEELDCRNSSFFFQTDILIRAVKKGYLFAEVPYRLGLRKEGISKALTFPSLLKVVGGYLQLVRDYYFSSNKNIKTSFADDSLTAKRRAKIN